MIEQTSFLCVCVCVCEKTMKTKEVHSSPWCMHEVPYMIENYAFMAFLDLLSFGYLDFQWRYRNFSGVIKNILFWR